MKRFHGYIFSLVLAGLCCGNALQAQQQKLSSEWITSYCSKSGNASSLRHFMIMPDKSVRTWAPGEPTQNVPELDNVIAIAGQSWFMVVLKGDGTVWVIGDNDRGQSGDPSLKNETHSNHYLQVPGLPKIKAISNNASGSCFALAEDGTVWAWGYGGKGYCGNNKGIQLAPVQIPQLTNVVAIGGAMALLKDGTVWSWGDGTNGRLGNGSVASVSTPVQVSKLQNVIAISGRDDGALALLRDGTVWAWGNNFKGQVGPQGNIEKPYQNDGFNSTPVQVTGISNAIAIDADAVCMALLKDGTVRVWGWGAVGGMGSGRPGTYDFNAIPKTVPNVGNVIAIKAGNGNGFALQADGTLMGWGGDMVLSGIYHQTWKPVVITKRS